LPTKRTERLYEFDIQSDMIAGEDYWLGQEQMSDEEYDHFLKKFRDRIKKSKPLKVLNPLNVVKAGASAVGQVGKGVWQVGTAIPNAAVNIISPKKKSSGRVVIKKRKATELTNVSNDQEPEEYRKTEEQVQQEEAQLRAEQEKTQLAEQEALDAQQSNAKQMLLFGTITIVGLVIVAGGIFYYKSRKNQLAALLLDDLA